MNIGKLRKKLSFVIIATLVSVACVSLYFCGAMTSMERNSYDNRMTFTSRFIKPSDEIVLVLVNQESLNWAKETRGWSWPWPRDAYAQIVDFFNIGGANSVAFDLMFTEPSVYGPQDDLAFAQASADFGRVVQTVFYDNQIGSSIPTLPVPELKESAGKIATVQSNFDSDLIARRNRFYSNSIYHEPTLAVASIELMDSEYDFSAIPQAKDGGMYIRFQTDINRFAPYFAKDILISLEQYKAGEEPILPPEDFEGMFVFFGLNAPGLFDICATPVSENYPGVGVHVCQMDTIISENYLRDIYSAVVVLIIVLMAISGAFLGRQVVHGRTISFLMRFIITVVIGIVYIALTYLMFVTGYILPVWTPMLALFSTYGSSIIKNYLLEGRQRRYLKHAFGQYLSPAVIENLIEHPEDLKLGGEQRELSVYFSDIQGFTSISENLTPAELTSFLNTYLSAMTDIILGSGGTIDKYEGDAIIAFWNAPVHQEDHAKRALDAAMKCQEKLAQMQEDLMAMNGGRPVLQRIGLNTGSAVVGNMGSKHRFDYTMIGDTVNLASRLEGMNKQFATYTMCSQTTVEAALKHNCDYKFRLLGNVAVVGKSQGIHVFEPMTANKYESQREQIEVFNKARDIFTAGDFAAAKEVFNSIASSDPAAKKYVEKCESMQKNPPENWDGVLRATEK